MRFTSSRNYESLLREGITAARNGSKNLAWTLLNQATQMMPLDPTPWLWLTETTDDLAEKIEYLEKPWRLIQGTLLPVKVWQN